MQIRSGVAGDAAVQAQVQASQRIAALFKQKTGLARISVNLVDDASRARLQPIKDIMNAAGVQRLSDLDVLRVTAPTAMSRGKVMLAPRKGVVTTVDWRSVAQRFKGATLAARQTTLAAMLTNRNSVGKLRQAPVLGGVVRPGGAAAPVPPVLGTGVPTPVVGGRSGLAGARPTLTPAPGTSAPRVPLARAGLRSEPASIGGVVRLDGGRITGIDRDLLTQLEDKDPVRWPVASPRPILFHALQTIPVDSAVMIAGTST